MNRAVRIAEHRAVAPAGVGKEIVARLGALAGHVVTTASATYARIGIGSVEAKVLFVLDQGAMNAASIAKALGVDRAAISRTVKALMERGLLNRSPSVGAALSLTPRGHAMHAAVRCLSEERERRLLARFTDAERAALTDYLARLEINVPALSRLANETAETLPPQL